MSCSHSNNDNDTNNNDLAVMMIPCQDCGHLVPESNMAIHHATACGGRARPHQHPPPSASAIPTSSNIEEDPTRIVGLRQRRMDGSRNNRNEPTENRLKTEDNHRNNNNHTHNEQINEDDIHSSEARRVQQHNVVDLTTAAAGSPFTAPTFETQNDPNDKALTKIEEDDDDNDDDDMVVEEQWSCPRCTLLNPISDSTCNACRYENEDNSTVRPPDSMRRERLVPEDPNGSFRMNVPSDADNINNNSTNSFQTMAGSALVGTLLGAAGAHWNGRPVTSGIMEGAVTGLVGGAFLGEVLRDLQQTPFVSSTSTSHSHHHQQQQQEQSQEYPQSRDVASARSSASMGLPVYPSSFTNARVSSATDAEPEQHEVHDLTESSPPRRHQPQPRQSVRVVRHSNGSGMTTSVYTSNGSTTTTTYNDANHPVARDPLLNLLMHSLMEDDTEREARLMSIMSGRGRHLSIGGGVDGMSYDELLQTFGDGSDNLGASESDIHSLPTAQIRDPTQDLPVDQRQCSICLEDFAAGDVRKTLPCLHGFHEDCANKWLRSNGCCPICKHKVSS